MESKMRRTQDTSKVISSRTAPRHPVPRGRVYRERCSSEGRHLAPPTCHYGGVRSDGCYGLEYPTICITRLI